MLLDQPVSRDLVANASTSELAGLVFRLYARSVQNPINSYSSPLCYERRDHLTLPQWSSVVLTCLSIYQSAFD